MRNYKLISSIFLIFILLLASYLRLYKISEYLTFLGDEGRDVLVVKRMIVDHTFTLLGPTASVGGFFLGPIYYYFMLPFLWLWKLDPSGPAVMVALFGVATALLLYQVSRDLFEPLVGFIASSLYVVSPLVIAYSRSSWNPNLVPFFSLLLIYLLWKVTAIKRKKNMFWIGIVLGIGLQLHYLFLFLFVLVALWLIIFERSRIMFNYYLLLIAGFLITYSPFILFEVRHGFPNSLALLRFFQEGKDTGFTLSTFILNTIDITYRSFARLIFRYPTRNVWELLPIGKKIIWNSLIIVSILLSFIFTFRLLLKFRKSSVVNQSKELQSKKIGITLLVIWFMLPVILFGFYKNAIYDYYLGIIFPVPFMIFGLLLAKLYYSKLGAIIASVFWMGLVIFNWEGRPFAFPPNKQLDQIKKIATKALEMTEKKPFNFALITGSNSDHAYRYFFEIWGNKPVTIENFTKDPNRNTVTDQLIVICEIDDCQPLGHSLWEIAGFGRAKIANESYVPFVKIYKLNRYSGVGS